MSTLGPESETGEKHPSPPPEASTVMAVVLSERCLWEWWISGTNILIIWSNFLTPN